MTIQLGEEISFHLVTTPEELNELVQLLQGCSLLALDTETSVIWEYRQDPRLQKWTAKALDPHTSQVRLIQLNPEGNPIPWVVDLWAFGMEGGRLTPEGLQALSPLVDVLMDPSIRKIIFNKKFDLKMLRSTLGVWLPNCWCPMLMLRLLGVATGFKEATQNRGSSYKAMCRDLFSIRMDKTEQSSDWGMPELTASQLEYAALDVGAPEGFPQESLLLEGYRQLLDVLTAPHFLEGGRGFAMASQLEDDQAFADNLARLEYTGIPISLQLLEDLTWTAEMNLNAALLKVCIDLKLPYDAYLDLDQNDELYEKVAIPERTRKTVNNPVALVEVINQHLSKEDKLDNLRAETLEVLLRQLNEEKDEEDIQSSEDEEEDLEEAFSGIQIIENLLSYKKLQKMVSMSYISMVHPLTGCIHAAFQEIGTGTSRASSGGSNSCNAQQFSNVTIKVDTCEDFISHSHLSF